jgi:hypothetical protein
VAAQLVVGPAGHLQEGPGPVRGGELERLGAAGLDHLLQRPLEGARCEPVGLWLVDDSEVGVDSGRCRVGGQQPPAEAVNRRDPGALARLGRLQQRHALLAPGLSGPAGELLADAASELVGGALGEGEREDPLDSRIRIQRRRAETVHQDRRLASPRSGAQEDVAVAAVHRLALLGRALAHSSSSSDAGSSSGTPRSRRQIGWKWQ